MSNQYDKEITDYSEAIRLNPKDTAAYFNRGCAYYEKKGDYDRAIADFEAALQINPDNSKFREALEFVKKWKMSNQRDNGAFIKVPGLVVEPLSDPSDTMMLAHLSVGYKRIDKGDYDEVIVEYNEKIRLNPKDAVAYLIRGYAYALKVDNDRAIADYDEAIRLKPDEIFFYYYRGKSYAGKGDYDLALADYSEAIRLGQSNGTIEIFKWFAKVYFRRGCVYYKKGDYDRAIADFEAASVIEPDKYQEVLEFVKMMKIAE